MKQFLGSLRITEPAFGIKHSRVIIYGGIEEIFRSIHTESSLAQELDYYYIA